MCINMILIAASAGGACAGARFALNTSKTRALRRPPRLHDNVRMSNAPVTANPAANLTNYAAAPAAEPRLTSLSHGGGCGCKIAPGVLSEILKNSSNMPGLNLPPELGDFGLGLVVIAVDRVLGVAGPIRCHIAPEGF